MEYFTGWWSRTYTVYNSIIAYLSFDRRCYIRFSVVIVIIVIIHTTVIIVLRCRLSAFCYALVGHCHALHLSPVPVLPSVSFIEFQCHFGCLAVCNKVNWILKALLIIHQCSLSNNLSETLSMIRWLVRCVKKCTHIPTIMSIACVVVNYCTVLYIYAYTIWLLVSWMINNDGVVVNDFIHWQNNNNANNKYIILYYL